MRRGKPGAIRAGMYGMGMLAVIVAAGCGASNGVPGAFLPPSAHVGADQVCPDAPAPQDAATLIVLDWDGGVSDQVPGKHLAAFNAAALNFADDSMNRSDLDAALQNAVLVRVQEILCDLRPLDVAVIAGEADDFPGATIVHITGDAPTVGKHIGQSDYDPCNDRADDSAVIWGGALASRLGPGYFEHWVNIFANTTAHEIGHTLGFTHPSEDTVARMLPNPSTEIMRSNVKPSELREPQWFLLQQETCPGFAAGEGSYMTLGEY